MLKLLKPLAASVAFLTPLFGAAMTQNDFAMIAINNLPPECRSSMGIKSMATRSIVVEPDYQNAMIKHYSNVVKMLKTVDEKVDTGDLCARERDYVIKLFNKFIQQIKLSQDYKIIDLFIPLNYLDGSLLDPLTFIFNNINSLILLEYTPNMLVERLRSYVNTTPLIPNVTTELKRQIADYGDEARYPYIKMLEDILDAKKINSIFTSLQELMPDQQSLIDTLKKQIESYNSFVTTDLLPKASTSCVLPRPLYQLLLELNGIDESPEALIAQGKKDFDIHFKQYKLLANSIAQEKNDPVRYPQDNPGAVLQSLIEDTSSTDTDIIIKQYHSIQENLLERLDGMQFVTLPSHPVTIRPGSAAEEAIFPVPHVNAPNFIGNTGDKWPEFVLCDVLGNASPAVAFALTTHEGCPGHVLQFSRMVEETAKGNMNLIQTTLASNPANAEGWAHYVEYPLSESFDPVAKLGAYRDQLLRMSRMFLDPQVNLGLINWDDVVNFHKTVLGYQDSTPESEAMRYTYYIQGQAPSYRYGALQIMQLREEIMNESSSFSEKKFHDSLLSFGLMPISSVKDLVRNSMLE